MKNKGFTLVELISGLVILSVIAVIVTTYTVKISRESVEKGYRTQIRNIELAAEDWGTDHMDLLPKTEVEIKVITLFDLKKGYIDKDVINPKTKEPFPDTLPITITYNGVKYKYKINE